jgi:MFS family permease
MLFGTSQNLGSAICIRLGQGLFSGSIGVARGGLRNITDRTNEGLAFTLISMSWGVGGIVGSIIGGLTEHPVRSSAISR